jgi:SAM-dependent methyltransferase
LANFGFQWNLFRKTQLDSYSGLPISKNRFFANSGWKTEELKDKLVLDVGCGAGRFTEIALSCGARVVAVDYSNAIEACWQNMPYHQNLELVQADIYHLPFAPETFDFVYCFGVLQHTPNPKQAFEALPLQLKPTGKLAVDIYPKLFHNILWPKYWLRIFTKRLPYKRLFPIVQRLVKLLFPISLFLGRIPLIGRKLKYLIPIVNYEGVYPLSKAQLRQWSVLDTFDMLSPKHDHPQTLEYLNHWFLEVGMKNIEVFRVGILVGRGTK